MFKPCFIRLAMAASLIACSGAGAATNNSSSTTPADTQASQRFHLVDGQTHAVIVGSDDIPSCPENGYRHMPGALSLHIKQSTGVELERITEAQYDPQKYPYAIFTGNTNASRERHGKILQGLDRDAYVVEITPHVIYLAGARSHSNGYAILDFLETEMGIATYIPSRWGTIVPRHETVILKPSLRVESPVFVSRAFSSIRTYAEKPDVINYGANVEIPWRTYRRDAFSHYIHTFITVKEYGKTHPEYFPEINGKRVIVSSGAGASPCISNPQVISIISEKVIAYFNDPKNQDKDVISMGMTDGGWCECENCRALDGADITGNTKAKSSRYYWFLNQVADNLSKVHPTKSLGVLAYAGADYPPADMRVARNIVPYICLTRANWGDPQVVRRHLEQTFAWSSRVNRIGVYEYLYGAGFMVPRLYSGMLAEYLRLVASQGQAGFYAEIYSNHSLDGPKAWITEKLLWNPYQNTAALQTHWCNAVFEEAAKPMDDYFAFLEECNRRNILRCPAVLPSGKARDSKFYLLQDEAQFELFTPADIDHARSLLEQARQLTGRAEILERINYFSEGLKVAELSCKAYHALGPARDIAANDSASPQEVLQALIAGEAGIPDEDPVSLMMDLTEKDSSMFTPVMPVSITTATKLSMDLINDVSWQAVRGAVAKGENNPAALRQLAVEALENIAPTGWRDDELASRRMKQLSAMASRITIAHRVDTAPAIDGDVSDHTWQWQKDSPWFAWKSGAPYHLPTEFAFCYKDNMLYYAFRAKVTDMAKRPTIDGYGAPAWKFVSSEVFLNPDDSHLQGEPVPVFQFIPALGGGLYANKHNVIKTWKVTSDDQYWQAEVAIDLAAIDMTPDKFKQLRVNIVNNTKEHGHYGKTWFPSNYANNSKLARGWLVFE